MSLRAAIAGVVALSAALGAQTPGAVPVTKEPHHRQLLYTAHLRLFEINVAAGESTLDHGHDRDMVTVSIAAPTFRTRQPGGEWSAPRSYVPGAANVTEYTGAPAVHRMEVIGKSPYRAMAVENLRERGWSMPRLVKAPGTTVERQSRSFTVYAVRLNPRQPQTTHNHQTPTVVTLVSGTVRVQGGGGESEFRLDSPGRWFASSWDQPHTLLAAGGEAYVVEVEAR
jgi:hypothetical protein